MSSPSGQSTTPASQDEKAFMRVPKKLIVCCDGTWMDSDNGWVKGSWGQPGHIQTPSNVTRIARAIKNEDKEHHPQIVYYQAGLGTGLSLYEQLMGGGTGLGLAENIREAYAFLASNYSPHEESQLPDSIFLMGFSRGAFTARSLGGFVAAVGILTKKALPFFYQCFEDWERAGDKHYKPAFIDTYLKAYPDEEARVRKGQPSVEKAHDHSEGAIDKYMQAYQKHLKDLGLTQIVDIQAIGCWDTVGALGIPINPIFQQTFHLPSFIRQIQWFDTRLSTTVKHAYHALAMDEHRAPYSPALWELNDSNQVTKLKQVWFAGAHGNIGGSYEDTGTADITLAWMMDHLSGKHSDQSKFKWSEWIQFDDKYIEQCFKQVSHYYNASAEGDVYRGWGMSKIFNTCTFPQSLAGERTRTPGMYHQTDYITGNYKPTLLSNTHECIHASIRWRLEQQGREIEPSAMYQKFFQWLWRALTRQSKPAAFAPQRPATLTAKAGPLHGWKLSSGQATQTTTAGSAQVDPNTDIEGISTFTWRYDGPDRTQVSDEVMEEDVFARDGYEQYLLDQDRAAKEKVFANWSWH